MSGPGRAFDKCTGRAARAARDRGSRDAGRRPPGTLPSVLEMRNSRNYGRLGLNLKARAIMKWNGNASGASARLESGWRLRERGPNSRTPNLGLGTPERVVIFTGPSSETGMESKRGRERWKIFLGGGQAERRKGDSEGERWRK